MCSWSEGQFPGTPVFCGLPLCGAALLLSCKKSGSGRREYDWGRVTGGAGQYLWLIGFRQGLVIHGRSV